MDPLSITATAGQLASNAISLVQFIRSFHAGSQGLPQKLDDLNAQLGAFAGTVDSIQKFLDDPATATAAIDFEHKHRTGCFTHIANIFEACDSAITRFGALLKQATPSDGGSNWAKRGWKALRLDDSDIDNLGTSLQRQALCMQLHLQCLTIGLQMSRSDTHKLEAENLQLRDFIDSLSLQCAQQEKTTSLTQTKEHVQLLHDMEQVKRTSQKVARAAKTELERRKTLVFTQPTPTFLPLGRAQSSSSPGSVVHSSTRVEGFASRDGKLHPDEFNTALSAVLSRAEARKSNSTKPFADSDFDEISQLLVQVGKQDWSLRPRTYLVLRLTNQVDAMSGFVLDGRKDVHFPYSEADLPSCLSSLDARQKFLEKQTLVLSEKQLDLVRGGRHRHFKQSGDTGFEILRQLGSGGSSIVHHVKSKLSQDEYALKRINRVRTIGRDKKALEDFEKEVHKLKKYSHHHLIRFVGSYTDPKYLGILMEPVADCDLKTFLQQQSLSHTFGAKDQEILQNSFGCLSSAVKYLHDNQCRHKDLKPGNILVHRGMVMITDFGIALDWSERGHETTVGASHAYTVAYAAPEVALSKPRRTSADIFSLGCVYLDIATVLAGETIRYKEDFFRDHGSLSAHPWQNSAAVKAWLDRLRLLAPQYTKAIGWIQDMTAEEPLSRPSAAALLGDILASSSSDQRYIGSCCDNADDSEVASYCGSDTEDEAPAREIFSSPDTTGSSSTTPERARRLSPTPKHDMQPIFNPDALSIEDDRIEDSSSSIQPQSANKPDITALPPDNMDVPTASNESATVSQSSRSSPTPSIMGASQQVVAPDDGAASRSNLKEIPALTIPAVPPASENAESPTRHARKTGQIRGVRRSGTTKQRPVATLNFLNEQVPRLDIAGTAANSLSLVPVPSQDAGTEVSDLRAVIVSVSKTEDQATTCSLSEAEQETIWERIRNLYKEDDYDFLTGLSILRERYVPGWKDTLLRVIDKDEKNARRNTLLHHAPYADDGLHRDLIELLINAGADPRAQDMFGNTPLHCAADVQDASIMKYLLLKGADCSQANIAERTALHVAASKGNESCVRALGRFAKLAGMVNANDELSRTPLHYACIAGSPEVVCLLLELGADPTALDSKLRSPLDLCEESAFEVMEDLFEDWRLSHDEHDINTVAGEHDPPPAYETVAHSSASVRSEAKEPCACTSCCCDFCNIIVLTENLEDADGDSILFCRCADHLNSIAVNHLLWYRSAGDAMSSCMCQGCCTVRATRCVDEPADEHDEEINAALDSLGNYNKATAANTLRQAGFSGKKSYINDPDTAFTWTINHYDNLAHAEDVFALLLSCGANTERVGSKKLACLHLAAIKGNLTLAALLLENGANVNVQRQHAFASKNLYTPLMYALWYNHAPMVKYLIQSGANLEITNSDGMTAAHCAAMAASVETAGVLLAAGAQSNVTDEHGKTPLHIAVERGDVAIVKLFIGASANVNCSTGIQPPLLQAIESHNAEIVEALLDADANVHAHWGCAVVKAAQCNRPGVLCQLLDYDDIRHHVSCIEPGNGRSALHLIAPHPLEDTMIAAQALLNAGADVNAKDETQSTPLHAAAKAGSSYYCSYLLSCGAVPTLRNAAGKTALDLAMAKRHREAVEVLGGTLGKKKWYQL